MSTFRLTLHASLFVFLTGCATSRYDQAHDSTPEHSAMIEQLAEPKAISEPLSTRGNPDEYEVWGKRYQVQKGIQQYKEAGIASWYGQKFHGHDTSNGERFDVYQFTAAHKSLPLPSYVRVTNKSNGKQLVVRVNDRGPFHEDRLIDLSYAAAERLGFRKQGTAQVEVELIAAPIDLTHARHLQIGAFQAEPSALNLQSAIAKIIDDPVYISKQVESGRTLHKVRIGPVSSTRADEILQTLSLHNYPTGVLLPH